MTTTIRGWLAEVWVFLVREGVLRQCVVGVSLWMTWESFMWAADYAVGREPSTAGAAMIAAVLVPVVGLQKVVFDWWRDTGGKK